MDVRIRSQLTFGIEPAAHLLGKYNVDGRCFEKRRLPAGIGAGENHVLVQTTVVFRCRRRQCKERRVHLLLQPRGTTLQKLGCPHYTPVHVFADSPHIVQESVEPETVQQSVLIIEIGMELVVPLEQVADGSCLGGNRGHRCHRLQIEGHAFQMSFVFAHILAKLLVRGFRRGIGIDKLLHLLDSTDDVLFDGHQMGIDAKHVVVEPLARENVLVNLPKIQTRHDEKVDDVFEGHGRQIGQGLADEVIARHVLQHRLVDAKGDGDATEFEYQKGKQQKQKGHDQGNGRRHHVGHGQDLQNRGRFVHKLEQVPFDETVFFQKVVRCRFLGFHPNVQHASVVHILGFRR